MVKVKHISLARLDLIERVFDVTKVFPGRALRAPTKLGKCLVTL